MVAVRADPCSDRYAFGESSRVLFAFRDQVESFRPGTVDRIACREEGGGAITGEAGHSQSAYWPKKSELSSFARLSHLTAKKGRLPSFTNQSNHLTKTYSARLVPPFLSPMIALESS